MPEQDDHQLLAEFVREDSESAFSELVRRYIALVYSTALRFSSNPHHAEEITQAVFIILARKAGTLSSRVVLSGWLYQAARLTAANFVKGEIRRARREQEVYMQSTLPNPELTDWDNIAPLLDEAMGKLGETDRNALVLRFFENRTSAEIGSVLRMDEDTARRRVNRALEKLRKIFSRHGVNSSAETIAGVISTNSIQTVPAAVTQSVTAAAVAKGAATSTSTLTLIKGALKIMAWSQAKTAITTGTVLLLAAGTVTFTVKKITAQHFDQSWRTQSIQPAQIDRLPPLVAILPTKFPPSAGSRLLRPGIGIDKFVGINVPVDAIASLAYRNDDPLGMPWPRERMIFTTPEPRQEYDFVATLSQGSQEALRQELEKKLGYVGHRETRTVDALALKVSNPNAPHLTRASGDGYGNFNVTTENGQGLFTCDNQPISFIAGTLERQFHKPVIDQTGLTQHYNIDLRWDEQGGEDALKKALREQAGLELTPSRESIEMLVVDKVK